MRFSQILCFGLLSQFLAQVQVQEQVLSPKRDLQVTVGVGEAKFLRFNCLSPADVVVTLNSYSRGADPLLFISVDPNSMPSFGGHESSTFSHWLEDKAGVHYATAKGLGPNGGILGLMNVRNFAAEELKAVLSLRCSYVVAFDLFFWDHLRSSAVCPSLPASGLAECSGHGKCSRSGECQCDSHHAGPACEHSKMEVLHNSRYEFQLAPGHYQYFRVHIPPKFPGGYLKVEVHASDPVVVLVRYDDLPTKAVYDLSNFDDWIERRDSSTLRFKVEANQELSSGHILGPPPFDGPESLGMAGVAPAISDGMPSSLRPTANMDPNGQAQSLKDGISGSLVGEMPGSMNMGEPPRKLQAANASRQLQDDQCPRLGPDLRHPACSKLTFLDCEAKCKRCLNCVGSGQVASGQKDACSGECQECILPKCTRALAACAGDKSCSGPEAQRCELGCGSCLSCLDSPDGRCGLCKCCSGCLPLAAKCMQDGASETRYVFVGILHHKRYTSLTGMVTASAEVSLVEDEEFLLSPPAQTWTAKTYNQFQDLRNVEITNAADYPHGEQFVYTMEIREEATAELQARTFEDRMTLVHLRNVHKLHYMQMSFVEGPTITHVLVSSRAAPKTLFDFDQVFTEANGQVQVHAHDRQDMWCAIFGGQDGTVRITVKAAAGPGSNGSFGAGMLLLFVSLALCCYCGGGLRSAQEMASDWLKLARGNTSHESVAALTVDPLQGYSGSDVIDRNVEDQYLHRGGLGDEGL